jgi:hypothetical protein
VQLDASLHILDQRFHGDRDPGHAFRLAEGATDLVAGLRERLALFAGEELCKRFLVLTQDVRDLLEAQRPVLEGRRAPIAKGTAGRGDGAIELRTGRRRAAGEHAPGCGVDHVECALAADELAVDELLEPGFECVHSARGGRR